MVYSLAVNWKKNQKVNLSIKISDDGRIDEIYVDDDSLSLDEVKEVEEWLEINFKKNGLWFIP